MSGLNDQEPMYFFIQDMLFVGFVDSVEVRLGPTSDLSCDVRIRGFSVGKVGPDDPRAEGARQFGKKKQLEGVRAVPLLESGEVQSCG